MTDFPHKESEISVEDSSQPPRRPGWGLIHDVSLRQTPHSVALKQPESRQQPLAKPVLQTVPQKPAIHASRKRLLIQWTKRHILVVCAPLIIGISILLSSIPVVGEILIGVYGLTAFLRRIPSRTSFLLATIVLTGIGLEFLLLPQVGRVDNSSLFVFLLLIIGFISATLETRRMQRQEKAFRVDNTTAIISGKTRG